MSVKLNSKAKLGAVGVAMVALSGPVPEPLIGQAQAASSTVAASGSFTSGIILAFAANLNFGKIVAAKSTGTATFTKTAYTIATSDGFNVSAGTIGKIAATFANSTLAVDVKATWNNAGVTLKGAGANGSVTINKIYIQGIITTAVLSAPGTITKGAAQSLTGKTGNISVGAQISWNAPLGTLPKGTFNEDVTVVVTY